MASTAASTFGTDVATALLAAASRREGEMVDHLVMLAQLESPSSDPAAQQPVLDHVEAELVSRGARTLRVAGAGRSGGTLVAAMPPASP